jgi:hypothetical protein
MNGGITWEEAWSMSAAQRRRVVKFLEHEFKQKAKALTGKEYM